MSAKESLEIVSRLLAVGPGRTLVSEDNADTIQVRGDDLDLGRSVGVADDAVRFDGTVQVEAELGSSRLILEAHSDGWSVDAETGDAEQFFPGPKARYTSTEVVDVVQRGSVVVTFSKASWGLPFVGWSVDTLERWLVQSGSLAAAEALLSAGPGRIALFSWDRQSVRLGPFLTLGDLAVAAPSEATPNWPERRPEWVLRAALVSTEVSDLAIAGRLNHICESAALDMISETNVSQPDGSRVVILDRQSGREWRMERTGESGPETCNTLRQVIGWVLEEPVRTRLVVARRTLSQHLMSLEHSPDPAAVRNSSEVAYRAAVDDQVGAALAAQAKFEDHAVQFSSKLNDLARSLEKTTDEVIVRTLGALLALLVTSVIAKDVRGWPVLVASIGVGVYVAWVASAVLGAMVSDARSLHSLTSSAFAGRPRDVSKTATDAAERSVRTVITRIRWRQVALGILLVATVATGIALYAFVDEHPDEQGDTTGQPSMGATLQLHHSV